MFAPLCIFAWLTLQAIAILLAALRVPLWIHAPAAGEFLAFPILLSVQILSASLLFPRLTGDWQTAVIAIASAWPFAALAGLLSASSVSTVMLAGGYASAWLLVLWIWRRAFHTNRSQMIGVAVAAGWSAAGPVLLFIRSEYANPPPTALSSAAHALLGPLIGSFSILDDSATRDMWPWIILAAVAAAGGGAMWGKRMLSSHFKKPAQTSR